MKDKLRDFSLYAVGILSAIILLWLTVNRVLPVLMPFIIAWLIATFTREPAERLAKKTRSSVRVTRLMTSLFFVLVVVLVLGLFGWQVVSALRNLLMDLGEGGKLYEFINSILSLPSSIIGDRLPDELYARVGDMIGSFLTSLLSGVAEGVTGIITGLPRTFLFLLVTIISLVYFSLDYDRISGFVRMLLPERLVNTASRLCDGILKVLGRYIRSYSLIMLITYITLFTGFFILSVDKPWTVALLVAILDILPIIGVGTVLIPWGIFEIAMGNKMLGIGLIVLFVVNAIIRQFSEPKIVGKSLDLHPIITLILLYVGYALFGIIGLILLPVLAVSIGVALKNDSSAQIG